MLRKIAQWGPRLIVALTIGIILFVATQAMIKDIGRAGDHFRNHAPEQTHTLETPSVESIVRFSQALRLTLITTLHELALHDEGDIVDEISVRLLEAAADSIHAWDREHTIENDVVMSAAITEYVVWGESIKAANEKLAADDDEQKLLREAPPLEPYLDGDYLTL
jgi:hypothetical protein